MLPSIDGFDKFAVSFKFKKPIAIHLKFQLNWNIFLLKRKNWEKFGKTAKSARLVFEFSVQIFNVFSPYLKIELGNKLRYFFQQLFPTSDMLKVWTAPSKSSKNHRLERIFFFQTFVSIRRLFSKFNSNEYDSNVFKWKWIFFFLQNGW